MRSVQNEMYAGGVIAVECSSQRIATTGCEFVNSNARDDSTNPKFSEKAVFSNALNLNCATDVAL